MRHRPAVGWAARIGSEFHMDPVTVLQEKSQLARMIRVAAVLWLDDARRKARQQAESGSTRER